MHTQSLEKEDLNKLNWLTPFDYGSQHSDLLSRHQLGTCQWFLNLEPFQTWSTSEGRTLFCPGIPESGKTIIASIVVNLLSQRCRQNDSMGLAYIYCSYQRRNQQDLRSLLASVIKQLCQTLPTLPQEIRDLYNKYGKPREDPPIEELMKCLMAISRRLSEVFLVVDALDECRSSDDCRAKLISHLSRIQDEAKVNIMYTARHVPEIDSFFTNCLRQPIKAKVGDIGTFVDCHLPRILEGVQGSSQLGDNIKAALTGLVDGMFLLVQLYMNAFKDTTSVAEVRKILRQLEHQQTYVSDEDNRGHVLDQVYDQAMERIRNQPANFRNLGIKTLMWIVFAERPLAKTELQYALAIEERDVEFNDEKVSTIDRILSTCAGLITIDEHSDTVRLAHFTTQEYLIAKQNEYFPSAQSEVTSVCATYLRFKGLWQHAYIHTAWACKDFHCQFLEYAASYWSNHARKSALHVPSTLIDLLTDEDLVGYIWEHADTKRGYYNWPCWAERYIGAYGLHVAVHFDLLQVANLLIRGGADIDWSHQETRSLTPLMFAAKGGKESFVALLLEEGASVDEEDNSGRTALVHAWASKHKTVIEMLLNKGADPRKLPSDPRIRDHYYQMGLLEDMHIRRLRQALSS
ncbi:ankyrin repeat protein [Colletotrichum chrysophilum]|uniref:Ankyrin repeat protein n=1 Tax=Colletotrichum chrysophilum TaxID=1836956 RepID=A0AAD9AS47_9PEZI|nr:ankyrin repeat protein [Colletotrichum chrysophilum]